MPWRENTCVCECRSKGIRKSCHTIKKCIILLLNLQILNNNSIYISIKCCSELYLPMTVKILYFIYNHVWEFSELQQYQMLSCKQSTWRVVHLTLWPWINLLFKTHKNFQIKIMHCKKGHMKANPVYFDALFWNDQGYRVLQIEPYRFCRLKLW